MGDLEPGQQVAERYIIEALIGTGGFADVYRVRHRELGSSHALKVLTWRKKGLAERFLNEGRVQANLNHPNVVTVTDVLRFDGHVALVMEYIDGTNLEMLITERGALPLGEAMALFVPVLAAVAAAHDRKIWHRDLKPANVLLAKTPVGWVPKVADFGIAKIVEEMGDGNTSSGIAMGSAGYMAPEQVRDSATVDQRTDVFALGAVLYEMLTGRRAFGDDTGSVSITSTLERDPPLITDPAIPPETAYAIQRAMHRDREQRFKDCRALAKALGIGGHPLLLDAEGRAMFGSIEFDQSNLSTLGERVAATITPSTSTTHAGGWMLVPFAAGTLIMVVAGLLIFVTSVLYVVIRGQLFAPQTATTPVMEPLSVAVVAPAPAAVATAPLAQGTAEATSVSPGVPNATQPVPAAQPPVPEAAQSKASPTEQPLPALPKPQPDITTSGSSSEETPPATVEITPPSPEPQATPVPSPGIDPRSLLGEWKGTAQRIPLQMKFTSATADALRGEVTFITGTSGNTIPLTGSFDPNNGAVMLRSSDGTKFEGRLQGETLSGTYQRGSGKLLEWSVRR